jgi:hypothetical protein
MGAYTEVIKISAEKREYQMISLFFIAYFLLFGLAFLVAAGAVFFAGAAFFVTGFVAIILNINSSSKWSGTLSLTSLIIQLA